MKAIILLFVITFSITKIHSQIIENLTNGGWYNEDTATKKCINFFIKKDGIIQKCEGLCEYPILDKNLKKGKYTLSKNNILSITWDNGIMEIIKIKFIDKNTIQIYNIKPQNEKLTFRRVIDEEIYEPPPKL